MYCGVCCARAVPAMQRTAAPNSHEVMRRIDIVTSVLVSLDHPRILHHGVAPILVVPVVSAVRVVPVKQERQALAKIRPVGCLADAQRKERQRRIDEYLDELAEKGLSRDPSPRRSG